MFDSVFDNIFTDLRVQEEINDTIAVLYHLEEKVRAIDEELVRRLQNA